MWSPSPSPPLPLAIPIPRASAIACRVASFVLSAEPHNPETQRLRPSRRRSTALPLFAAPRRHQLAPRPSPRNPISPSRRHPSSRRSPPRACAADVAPRLHRARPRSVDSYAPPPSRTRRSIVAVALRRAHTCRSAPAPYAPVLASSPSPSPLSAGAASRRHVALRADRPLISILARSVAVAHRRRAASASSLPAPSTYINPYAAIASHTVPPPSLSLSFRPASRLFKPPPRANAPAPCCACHAVLGVDPPLRLRRRHRSGEPSLPAGRALAAQVPAPWEKQR